MTIPQRVIDRTLQIQQIPAPTFEEEARAQFVLQKWKEEGLTQPQTDSAGNVFACLPGEGKAPPLIVSAHLDTVFPASTDLKARREAGRIYAPGIGDNSLGVGALFGLLWMLREAHITLPGDLWLAANTGEEGLGDLKGMKALCAHFGAAPLGYLVLEGMAYRHVYTQGIGVRRYRVEVHTPGGHSWSDYGKPSALHILAGLVTQLTSLRLPGIPRTTLNVGRMQGGTSINTIAAEAWMELDLRSESEAELLRLVRRVESTLEAVEQRGVGVEWRIIGSRPAGEIPLSHPWVRLAESVLRQQGAEPIFTLGSTDANLPLSLGYPALVLGLTNGGGAHTLNEFIETTPLEAGLEQLFRFVCRAWEGR